MDENRANAAHIVHCVNLHDELVEALELLLPHARPFLMRDHPAMLAASAILAKVKCAVEPGASVALFCSHGKHRSVAVAVLVGAVLQREGFMVSVKHSNLHTAASKCVKGVCSECRTVPVGLVEEVRDLWRSL
jgi:hypothetical protein